MKYVIRHSEEFYVYGFSARGQGCVVKTADITQARKFKTRQAAQAWGEKYSDKGFGLVGNTTTARTVGGLTDKYRGGGFTVEEVA